MNAKMPPMTSAHASKPPRLGVGAAGSPALTQHRSDLLPPLLLRIVLADHRGGTPGDNDRSELGKQACTCPRRWLVYHCERNRSVDHRADGGRDEQRESVREAGRIDEGKVDEQLVEEKMPCRLHV